MITSLSMPGAFWNSVTHLGNATLLLPAAAVLALWMLAAGQRQRLMVWSIAFGGTVLLVLASKLAFLGWGVGVTSLDFTGVSGHATLATAVLTLGLWLPVSHRSLRVQVPALALGVALGVLVGISRLELRAHSVSEVVAGCLLGAGAALLPVVWPPRSVAPIRHRWVAAALAAALLLTPQARPPAEAHGLVVQMALLASGRGAAFTRDAWRAVPQQPQEQRHD